MTGEDVKKLSRFVAAAHNEDGGGIFAFNGGDPKALLVAPEALVAFDDLAVANKGKRLREGKDIRALIHKGLRRGGLNLVEGEHIVIWTLYDEETDYSLAGVAALQLQEATDG